MSFCFEAALILGQEALEVMEQQPIKDIPLIIFFGLADRSLSDAYPTGWVKLLYDSHPPLGERLAWRRFHLLGADGVIFFRIKLGRSLTAFLGRK